jgi:hypothetical protein
VKNLPAALLAVITIVAASAAFGIAAFLFAYPEVGVEGWLLVAAIVIVWAVACGFLFRAWNKS